MTGAGAVILLSLLLPSQAMQVDEVRWGFDGWVVPHCFQPLSVLMSNPTGEPVSATVVLECTQGIGRVGAPLAKDVYLSPYARRWVQFYPYVANQWTGWRLVWGRNENQRFDLAQPSVASGPVLVQLTDGNALTAARGGVARFDEAAFPPSVTATDALGAAILDHEPRWEPVRRAAFMSWLRRGGVAVIMHESPGSFPTFTAELSPLNTLEDLTPLGSGWIMRRPILARDITAEIRDELNLFADDTKQTVNMNLGQSPGDQVIPALKQFTRPEHNWPLIFTLSIAYILLLGPINWLIGRKVDYKLALGVLAVSVITFGAIFFRIGQRGFGETDRVHSFAYARPLGDGACDVTQWTNLFVTAGDTYTLAYDSPFNLYSTYFQNEPVPGVIRNGAPGSFDVTIPMYASREVVQRSVLPLQGELIASIEEFQDSDPPSIKLRSGPGFPDDVFAIWLVYQQKVYSLKTWDGLIVGATQGVELTQYRQQVAQTAGMYTSTYYYYQDTNAAARQRNAVEAMGQLLLLHNFARYTPKTNNPPAPMTDRAQLFILATAPDAWQPERTDPPLGRASAHVVYHIDLFPQENRIGP